MEQVPGGTFDALEDSARAIANPHTYKVPVVREIPVLRLLESLQSLPDNSIINKPEPDYEPPQSDAVAA